MATDMKLYITDIKNITLDRISELNSVRAEKAMRYKMPDDKKRSIAGGLFINKFLGDVEVYENEYGKPITNDDIYFNISHSGDYVIFALSDNEVGCDIQKIEFVRAEKIAKIMFCDNEISLLTDAIDKTGEFFKLWTKKESLLKCMGEGFHRNSKNTDISYNIFKENGKEYYFRIWNFSDYIICICSESNDFPDDIEFIDL